MKENGNNGRTNIVQDAYEMKGSLYVARGSATGTVLTPKELEAFFEEEGLGCERLEKLNEVIAQYRHKPGSLIPVLQQAQAIVGYLPTVVQKHIATGLGIPASDVFSVVTFYSFFTMIPRGRHTIRVCLGTACYVSGGNLIVQHLGKALGIRVGQTTKDRRFTLESVRCLGCCSLAPVMLIDEDVHQQLGPRTAINALSNYK